MENLARVGIFLITFFLYAIATFGIGALVCLDDYDTLPYCAWALSVLVYAITMASKWTF